MKEPYEKGVAIHSAPSFAVRAVKSLRKRKQGYRRVGYRASKSSFGAPTLSFEAEGNMARSENASPWSALRSLQTPSTPGNSMHENRETSETPEVNHTTGRWEKAVAARPACTSLRSRTAE
jgi:hypothetical protein